MSIYIKDSKQQPRACIIWLHGLGADAQDMVGLAHGLKVEAPIRHIFLDAPVRPITWHNGRHMRGWYDLPGVELNQGEDREGILASEHLIRQSLNQQIQNGMDPSRIFIAGFSQGGVMSILTGLKSTHSLAGVIGLSTYVAMRDIYDVFLNVKTPLFLATGIYDPVVLPVWSRGCRDWLNSKGFHNIEWHEYPMEHSVCREEIHDLSVWLTNQISKLPEMKDSSS